MADSMEDLVKEFARLSAVAEDAARAMDAVKSQLLEAMQEEQIKTSEVREGDKIYRATFVQSTTTQIDEKGFLAEAGDDADLYMKKVFDRKALEQALEDGTVNPYLVGRYVTERKSKPSVRFTQRVADISTAAGPQD